VGGEVVIIEFVVALCMGLGALAFFVWAVMSGNVEDMEDVKYRILERDEKDG